MTTANNWKSLPGKRVKCERCGKRRLCKEYAGRICKPCAYKEFKKS